MANAVQIPVQLQFTNVQDILNTLKNQLSNLKVGSTAFRALENSIRVISNEVDKLQITASKPFMSEKQFTSAEHSIDKIEQEMSRVQLAANRIKFSDLKLDSSQQSQLKSLQDQIDAIRNSLKNVKEDAKQGFLGSDMGKLWTSLNPADVSSSLDQITNHIKKAVNDQNEKLKAAEDNLRQYQAAFNASNLASQVQGASKKGKDPFTTALGDDFSSFFSINKNGGMAFKAGQQPFFEEWLKNNLQVDPSVAADLVKKSANQIRAAFNDETSALRQDIAQKASQKGTAAVDLKNAQLTYDTQNQAL